MGTPKQLLLSRAILALALIVNLATSHLCSSSQDYFGCQYSELNVITCKIQSEHRLKNLTVLHHISSDSKPWSHYNFSSEQLDIYNLGSVSEMGIDGSLEFSLLATIVTKDSLQDHSINSSFVENAENLTAKITCPIHASSQRKKNVADADLGTVASKFFLTLLCVCFIFAVVFALRKYTRISSMCDEPTQTATLAFEHHIVRIKLQPIVYKSDRIQENVEYSNRYLQLVSLEGASNRDEVV